ncbi:MAG: DUF938 domain-containing protein [Wenzhouxiangella sp.]
MMNSELPYSEASERNREPIAAVLEHWLGRRARVLEIGSGTGQHAVFFHRRLPGLDWQASDLAERLPSLRARFELEAPDLPPPIELDVAGGDWPDGARDAIFTANTLHIMPGDNMPALIGKSADLLCEGGLLIVYGPFRYGSRHTSDSNRRFDESLRRRDPVMGVRDARELTRLAGEAGLAAEADIAMPANNRILIYRKSS